MEREPEKQRPFFVVQMRCRNQHEFLANIGHFADERTCTLPPYEHDPETRAALLDASQKNENPFECGERDGDEIVFFAERAPSVIYRSGGRSAMAKKAIAHRQ